MTRTLIMCAISLGCVFWGACVDFGLVDARICAGDADCHRSGQCVEGFCTLRASEDDAKEADAEPTEGLDLCDYQHHNGYVEAFGDECDLIAQDCGLGLGCFPIDEEGRSSVSRCLNVGDGECSEHCEAGNDCLPGLLCIKGAPDRCVAMCQMGTECPDKSMCAPLTGRDDVGVCR